MESRIRVGFALWLYKDSTVIMDLFDECGMERSNDSIRQYVEEYFSDKLEDLDGLIALYSGSRNQSLWKVCNTYDLKQVTLDFVIAYYSDLKECRRWDNPSGIDHILIGSVSDPDIMAALIFLVDLVQYGRRTYIHTTSRGANYIMSTVSFTYAFVHSRQLLDLALEGITIDSDLAKNISDMARMRNLPDLVINP